MDKKRSQHMKGADQGAEGTRVLVFRIGSHEHAVPLEKVKEIVRLGKITPVLEALDFVEGVISLRGTPVPVVDLRKRVGLLEPREGLDTCIVVVLWDKGYAGFIVDKALELVGIREEEVQPPTEIISGMSRRFMKGVLYLKGRLIVILEPDEILTMGEKEVLAEALECLGGDWELGDD